MESAGDSDMEVASVLAAGITKTAGREASSRNSSQPSTMLTNMTRGNWETPTTVAVNEPDIFQLAALGEIAQLTEKLTDMPIDTPDSHGLTALMWASSYGQVDTVRSLLSQEASVHCSGQQEETALMLSVASGHAQIGQLLLRAGSDVDACDKKGNTALMYAVYNNFATCVSLLLKWGADMMVVNQDGHTAVDISVTLQHRKVQYVIDEHLKQALGAR